MARKPREQEAETTQDPYASQPNYSQTSIVDTTAELVNASPVRASAEENREPIDAPPAPRYRVLNTQYVMARGGRTILRAGKTIDSMNYDIESLVGQGVQLEATG